MDKVKVLLMICWIKPILFDKMLATESLQHSKDDQNGTGEVKKGNVRALEFGCKISAF